MSGPAPRDGLGSAELAAEIVRTRSRLSHGLAVLDREYALRHLVVRAARLARKPALDTHQIGELIRRDGVPLAFIGLGLAWLALAGRGAGDDLLRRLGGAVAALQHLARELGLVRAEEPPGEAGPPLPPAGPAG